MSELEIKPKIDIDWVLEQYRKLYDEVSADQGKMMMLDRIAGILLKLKGDKS